MIGTHIAVGRLHPEHRGVYAVGHAAKTPRGTQMSAVLACGPDAVLSHQSAAAIHGLMRWDGRPHVTTRRSRGPISGVVTHRSRCLGPADLTTVDGLPVTSWARTVVDLADLLPMARIVRVLEQAAIQELYDDRQLVAARRRCPGRRGARRLETALALGYHRKPQRTRSPLEERFLDLVRGATPRLPDPSCNAIVVVAGGESIEVDVLFAAERVVVELDSARYHGHAVALQRDAERDRALDAAGFEVLRLCWRAVVHERGTTIRRIRSLLA